MSTESKKIRKNVKNNNLVMLIISYGLMISVCILLAMVEIGLFKTIWKSRTQAYSPVTVVAKGCFGTSRGTASYCYVVEENRSEVQTVTVGNKYDYGNGNPYTMYKFADGSIEESPNVPYAWDLVLTSVALVLIFMYAIYLKKYHSTSEMNKPILIIFVLIATMLTITLIIL